MSVRAMTWAWGQRTGAAHKAVLLALADHADDQGICWPGQRGIAAKVEKSDRAVRDSLKALERQGHISRTRRGSGRGGRQTDLYQLHVTELPEDSSGRGNRKLSVELPEAERRGNRKLASREPSVEPSEPSKIVFEHWRTVLSKNGARFTSERRKKIGARLAEGYTVEQIKRAVDGCRASAFHQGENESGRRYDDLTLICRSGSKLEEFMELAKGPQTQQKARTDDLTLRSRYESILSELPEYPTRAVLSACQALGGEVTVQRVRERMGTA